MISLSIAMMPGLLPSEDNRVLNHMGQRTFTVTQSIKKLPAEDRAWVLNKIGFKRLADDKPVDLTKLTDDGTITSYFKKIKFADIEEQSFMPVYEYQEITDDLHETCGFKTDYQFITKRKMKGIQKSKRR